VVVVLAQRDAAAHASISVVHLRTHCSSASASASPTPGAAATTGRQVAVGTCRAATKATATVSHAAVLPMTTPIDGLLHHVAAVYKDGVIEVGRSRFGGKRKRRSVS
jgi:hypothetical protein